MFNKIGHRGIAGVVTENSIEGFKKVIELGFQAVEFDVQLTSDGVPVVIHDKSLDRTTNSTGLLKDHSYEDLKNNVILDNGEQIPSLEQVLKIFKETTIKIYIELIAREKTTLIQDVAVNILPSSQIIFSSFHHDCLVSINKMNRQQRTMALFECSPIDPVALVQNCFANEAGIGIESISQKVVSRLQNERVKVYAWTVRDKNTLKIAQDVGVDGVFSDYY